MECTDQRLSQWVGHSPVFQSLLQIFAKHLSWSPRLLEQVQLVYYQLLQTSPFSVQLLRAQLPHEGLAVDLLLDADKDAVRVVSLLFTHDRRLIVPSDSSQRYNMANTSGLLVSWRLQNCHATFCQLFSRQCTKIPVIRCKGTFDLP